MVQLKDEGFKLKNGPTKRDIRYRFRESKWSPSQYPSFENKMINQGILSNG